MTKMDMARIRGRKKAKKKRAGRQVFPTQARPPAGTLYHREDYLHTPRIYTKLESNQLGGSYCSLFLQPWSENMSAKEG